MGDGRVDNITSQRGVLGDDDRIAGLRVDTKKENGLDAPGLMASGFNHVLTRLSGVYNVPDHDEIEAKSDAENDNKHLERNMSLTKMKKKKKREARGFYELKRSRSFIHLFCPAVRLHHS